MWLCVLLLFASTVFGLDCWEGCEGTLCSAASKASSKPPALVATTGANVHCFALCDPLGAVLLGSGSPTTIDSLKLLAGAAVANAVHLKACSTNGCNDPAMLPDCPTITNMSAIVPPDYMFGIRACSALNIAKLPGVCDYVPLGVTCPANYYCPPYSYFDIFMFKDVLTDAGCSFGSSVAGLTGNYTYAVICPCPPGFLCPPNTETPTHCPAGYYCPPNPAVTTTPFGTAISPNTGLGAFGSLAFVCPKDHWCSAGLLVPFECDLRLMDCPEGTIFPSTYKLIVVLLVIAVVMYLPLHVRFRYATVVRSNRLRQWEADREQLKNKLRENLREVSSASLGVILGAKLSIRQLRQSLGFGGSFSAKSTRDEIPNPLSASTSASESASASASGSASGSATELHDRLPPKFGEGDGVNICVDSLCFRAPNGKTIMYKASAQFRAGRMVAILGPSGAGKSTIISLITGKAKKTSGTVTVNGEAVNTLQDHPSCRGRIGFVPQEDVMLRDLSPSEIIAFSARFRLPVSVSSAEVQRRINECIDVLELEKVKDDVVGDERTRGISGGQRKRVNVGIELVADPKVLFLDEPTSGLDSTKSKRLCKILQDVTRSKNMTVAAVIHQPSSDAFLLFDDLLLLGAGGSVVYFGDLSGPRGAEAYFKSIGFPMPPGANPAEFFLDVAQGEVEHADLPPDLDEGRAKRIYLLNQWECHKSHPRDEPWTGSEENASYKQPAATDPEFERIQQEILVNESLRDLAIKAYHDAQDHLRLLWLDVEALGRVSLWAPTLRRAAWQLFLCLKRSWRFYREERALHLYAEMGMHCFSGLIVSYAGQHLIFVGPNPTPVCVIQALPLQPACFMPQSALYTQIGNFLCFGILFTAIASSSEVFSAEQPNYWRECSAGLFTAPYFLGHFLGMLPRMFVSAALFYLSFIFMYRNTGDENGLFLVVLGLYWFGYSLGYVTSQVASPQSTSLTGVLLALVFAVLFSGVLPALRDVQSWPAWQQFPWSLSGPRWGIEAFFVNSVLPFATIPQSPFNSLYVGAPYVDVDAVLQQVGYSSDNFDVDILGLLWNGIVWTSVAALLMWATQRNKTR